MQGKRALGAVILVMLTGVLVSKPFAEELDARALLERMSSEIAGLQQFIVRGEAYADARLPAGQIIQHASDVTLRIRRPDAMRLTVRTIDGAKELYFGGGLLALYSEMENLYAQAEVKGGIDKAADFAVNEVGIDAPMLDLLSNNIAERLQKDAQAVQYLGQDIIRGKQMDHVAIRLPEIDVQIWVASEGRSLPGKMVISSKWEGGSPRTSVFFDWNTDPGFTDEAIRFVPPANASEIDFLLENSQ
jgi:hypothetical protein